MSVRGGLLFTCLVASSTLVGCEFYQSQYDLIAEACDYRRPGGWKYPKSTEEAIENIVVEPECEDAIDGLFRWEGWEGYEQDRRGIVQALQVIAAYPLKYGKTFLGIEDGKGQFDLNFVCTLFPQWESLCPKTPWLSEEKNANRNIFDFIAHQVDAIRLRPFEEGTRAAFQSDEGGGSHVINLVEGRVFSVSEKHVKRDFQSPFIVAKLLAHEAYHTRGDLHYDYCENDAGGIVKRASQNTWGNTGCDSHLRGSYGFQIFLLQAFFLGAYGQEEDGLPIASDFDFDQIAFQICATLEYKINRFSPELRAVVEDLYDPEENLIDCELADRDWLADVLKADIEENAE